jgi:HD-GYP domain-containing protein (c-di-GMP phosphodiesterase class II)
VLADVGDVTDSREAAALTGAVEALAALVDRRDLYTGQHAQHVAALAVQVALAMGCDAAEARLIGLAGRLHDVGKIALPDTVLQNSGMLTAEEWALIHAVPTVGAEVVSRLPALRVLVSAIQSHHERWDGRGYPKSLAGDMIPLGGRVLAVADAYEAMTHDRPHQRARPPAVALAELKSCAGTQFDAAVVDALERVLLTDISPAQHLPARWEAWADPLDSVPAISLAHQGS